MKYNGHVPNLTNKQYHAAPGLSSSGLVKLITTTPAHYKASLEEERTETPAMVFGTAVHCALLEPERFGSSYVKKPKDLSFTTIEGKAWKQNAGSKIILSSEDWDSISDIYNKVMTHKTASALLATNNKEDSYFWNDQETGIPCKCRPDAILGDFIIDVKTTEDASPEGFQKSIMKYNYHLQSAHYLNGMSEIMNKKLTKFVHVVIEKKPPYAIACYVLDDASLELGQMKIKQGLLIYKECMENNKWPSYSEDIQTTSVPFWVWNKEQ